MGRFGLSMIRVFDAEVSGIEGMIKLTLGEPDFTTPEHVKKAAIKAIEENKTNYLPTAGILPLRQAIVNYLDYQYNLKYNPETEVAVTVGACEALWSIFAAIINPGDKVIIPTPAFGLYFSIIEQLGGEVIMVDTSQENFVLSAKRLEEILVREGDNVKAVLLNYPSNPTGVTIDEAEAKALADVLKKCAVFVISDEVYSPFVYEGEHVSIAKYLPEQTIVINGVSKSHAMTGWRLGFMVAPAFIMAELMKSHANAVTCATSISQYAALEALKNGQEDAIPMKEAYQERRDYIYKIMNKLGFNIAQPNGAFYIFAKIPENCIQDSYDFCVDLAKKAKVAMIPGKAFGEGGNNYVRLSYAASMDEIKNAMERLEQYIQANY